MMMKTMIAALLGLVALSVSAADPSGREIMNRNDAVRRSDDEQVRITMLLINSRGKKQSRELTKISKTQRGVEERTYIRFDAPPDVRRTALLTIDREAKPDDRWLYLPALQRTRRISSGEKVDSFMGTDFSYEDLENEELNGFNYELTGSQEIEGAACWVVRAVPSTPAQKSESAYGSRQLWIRKDTYTLVKTKFYDRAGQSVKEFKAGDVRQLAPNVWRAHSMEMTNVVTGHRTTLAFTGFALNKGVSDDTFTLRYLERPN